MSSAKNPITHRQIVAARELLGLNQGQLAEAVGMLPQALSRIESGKVKPRRESVRRIIGTLERLGIEFINGTGVKLKTPPAEQETSAD